MESYTENMDANMNKLVNSLKKDNEEHDGTEPKPDTGVARVAKITKPANVPTWTKT